MYSNALELRDFSVVNSYQRLRGQDTGCIFTVGVFYAMLTSSLTLLPSRGGD